MADTTVTGRIGEQEVALVNAASEATLQKLLEAFNRFNGSGSSSGNKSGGSGTPAEQQAQTKAVNTTTSAFNKAGEAVGKFSSAILSVTSSILGYAGTLIGGVAKGIEKLAKELLTGGERVSDFTAILADLPSFLGKFGGLINQLAGFIDKSVDQFRELSQVGAAFNNNIFEMRQAAASAGMNMDEFASMVKGNSQTMAMFGTSVTGGVKNFALLAKEMRNGRVGSELMNMGFTMTDLNESLLNYASINARMGRMRENSDKDLVERAGNFAKEMDLAAKVTGLNRKQLESAANAAMMDARMRTMIGAIQDKDQRARALANLAVMDSMKGLSPAFKDLATGAPMLEESFMLQTLSGGKMAKLMQQAARGQIDSIELNNELAKMYPEMQKKAQAMGPGYINALQKALPSMAGMLNNMGELATLTEKDREKVLKEQKRTEAITNFFATFENTIRNFRKSLEDTFLTSNLFKRLKGYFDGFLDDNSSKVPRLLKEIQEAFQGLLDFFDGFLSDIEKVGLADALRLNLVKILQDMFDIPEQLLAGLSAEDRLSKAFDILMSRAGVHLAPVLESVGKSIWEGISSAMLAGIKSFWENNQLIMIVGGAIAGLFVAKKLLSGGATTAAPAAGGAAAGGGALAGLGAQFTQAAGWLMKGVAIGASMIAIGFGLEKLGEGMQKFVGVDWETGGKAVAALTALGAVAAVMGNFIVPIGLGAAAIAGLGLAVSMFPAGTLSELAKLVESAFSGIGRALEGVASVFIAPLKGISEIVDAFGRMQTAGTEAATASVKALSNIPAANMTAAAAGVEAIKKALEGFNPGMFAGISEGIGSLFGKDKVGPLQQMAVLGPQLQTAAAGFTAFKTALTGMNLANLSMTSEQTSNFETLTRRLPAFTDSMTLLGAQATNINAAASAITAFQQASTGFDLKNFTFTKEQLVNLADGTTKLKALAEQLKSSREGFKKLDEQGLKNIKEGVEGLSKAFKDFNESFVNKFIPKFEELRSKTQEGLLSGLGDKLDTLNSTMTSLITIEDTSRKHLDNIANKAPGKKY